MGDILFGKGLLATTGLLTATYHFQAFSLFIIYDIQGDQHRRFASSEKCLLPSFQLHTCVRYSAFSQENPHSTRMVVPIFYEVTNKVCPLT